MPKTNPRVMEILGTAKRLAQEYRTLTGKPLGVTGEIAEYDAARILRLELTGARNEGYDAIERVGEVTRTLQIKGRSLQPGAKRSQRLGSIDSTKEWDAVLLVLLDENLDTTSIYEADRGAVIEALNAPGLISRNERGQLGVSKLKAIGKPRWKRDESVPSPFASRA